MPYDPKKTLKKFLWVTAFGGAGVLLADQAGITGYALEHLPAQYAQIGAVLIMGVFAAIKNWYSNQAKG